MAKPCLPFTPHTLIPGDRGSGERFSNEQIDLLRQVARESRSKSKVPRLRKKGEAAQGTLALFSGPSGSGKTLAAAMLARELGVSIYRVNLNQLVSQYIGETEKNLSRVLKKAEKQQVVLVFDEADALFGTRGAANGRHDRYANLEAGSVLERLKSYPGLVILIARQKVDLATHAGCFLAYHLNFPFPLRSPALKSR
jgi:SpoVK/Ycf46/Vps4 family AAA+-type ATPase